MKRLLLALPLSLSLTAQASVPLEKIQVFAEVFERIRANYVEEISDEQLLDSAIRGMLNDLDPHSSYLPPTDFEDMREDTRGAFGGLGIEVARDNGLIRVVTPIDGTPAERAGILPGDLIFQIDGTDIRGMDLNQAIELLRGPVGSEVMLEILRAGDEIELTLTRDLITVDSVRGQFIEPGFAWVRISQFQEDTGPETLATLRRLNDQTPLEGVVLDLRNNPGGVLGAAVGVVNAFVDEGIVVSTQPRDASQRVEFRAATSEFNFDNIPLVVLINQGSASASEIVAGAIQDMKRGVIMGTTSFGKGSVQTLVALPDDSALKLTTALYYTPSGRSIQNNGITPDIKVEQGTFDAQDEAFAFRERDLNKRLDNPTEALVEDEGEANALLAEDFQLSEALNMLKGISIIR